MKRKGVTGLLSENEFYPVNNVLQITANRILSFLLLALLLSLFQPFLLLISMKKLLLVSSIGRFASSSIPFLVQ